ncbi:MAG: choice-of-anchor J domain-containing protein [Bacteroidales bacterium]|nr:choice-of-anchor J domain-containing protein [Bacteroidales bacterium]
MKKVLLAALALFVGTSMFAQEKTVAKLSVNPTQANVVSSDRAVTGDSQLTYCTGDVVSAIGVGGGTYIEWGAAFRPEMYTADDNFVTSVDFFAYRAATYTLNIYDSDPAAAAPANLLYTRDYEVAEAEAWVNLPIYHAVVEIDHTKALWVAVGATDPDYPAAYSSDVLTTTDCCMMYFQGEWLPINQLGDFQIQPWMIVANTTSENPGVSCMPISTFPYYNDFENILEETDCWIDIDNDGDGYSWFTDTEAYWGNEFGVDGSNCLVSQSYDNETGSRDADNYLLSPEFVLPAGKFVTLSWYEQSQDEDWLDWYEVMVAPNGSTEISDFVSIYNGDAAGLWTERTADLTEYAGTTIRVVFHHESENCYFLEIDNMGIETAANCGGYGFPFVENFDSNGLDCWGNFDEDGDGHTWQLAAGKTGKGAQSESYSGGSSFDPDNWLISPEITLPATVSSEFAEIQLLWYVAGYSASYPDHYGVYISTTGDQPADFTTQLADQTASSTNFSQKSVSLMDYLGQTVRIAFRHFDSYDNWSFTIDDVEVKEVDNTPVSCDPITDFPYFNDFENFLNEKDCWIDIDNDGDGQTWFTGTENYWGNGFGVDGSNCLVSQSYDNNIGAFAADNYLVSPEFVLPAGESIKLSWYAQAQDPSYPDSYEVMIAPNGSTNVSDFVSVYGEISPNPWAERIADISAYAGTTVRVVFHHQDYDNYFVEIDNMKVEIYTGVEENNSEAVAVYPNPVKSVMSLTGVENGTEVRIYDVTGSEVMSFVYEGREINVEALANGVYVLRAGDNRIKFVK